MMTNQSGFPDPTADMAIGHVTAERRYGHARFSENPGVETEPGEIGKSTEKGVHRSGVAGPPVNYIRQWNRPDDGPQSVEKQRFFFPENYTLLCNSSINRGEIHG